MKYSLVLPTKNAAVVLPKLLDALDEQTIADELERVAVDSGSTDGTLALLRRAGFAIEEIPSASFAHGASRNLGISKTSGEFVFLLSQDAVPAHTDCLETLAGVLEADAALAGSYARQLPRAKAGPLEKLRWERSGAGSPRPRRVQLSADELARLPPEKRRVACEFHSAACCIRRSVWEQTPLPEVPIAEDVAWAQAVLAKGLALAYEPSARVLHSHHRPLSEEYVRVRDEAALEWELLSLAPVRSAPGAFGKGALWGLADALAVISQPQTPWRARVRDAARAAAFGYVRSFGLYRGYRKARFDE